MLGIRTGLKSYVFFDDGKYLKMECRDGKWEAEYIVEGERIRSKFNYEVGKKLIEWNKQRILREVKR